MDISTTDEGIYLFGPFQLDATRRILWRGDSQVKLPGRLFGTLYYLVKNAGRVVEKDELMAAVWADRIVEEGNLTQAVSALRKLLYVEGEQAPMIATISGRGYSFAAQVQRGSGTGLSRAAPIAVEPALPASPAEIPRARAVQIAVAGALLLGAGLLLWAGRRHAPPQAAPAFAPPALSVAVLPFANIGGGDKNDYLSDGLTDEVMFSLGQFSPVRVAARSSSYSLRKTTLPATDIARRLNVASILEGSIRWEGAHMRITTQLIDGTTGYQRWSQSYDRDQTDILHLETDIAGAITKTLQVSLADNETAKLEALGTRNPQALDAYLRGNMLKRKLDVAATKQALAAADEALALDPHFVLAHILRARVLTNMAQGTTTQTSDSSAYTKLGEQAVAESRLAVSLAPTLGDAYDVLAVALQQKWDFNGAAVAFARARTLSPNDAAILRHFLWFQALMGHAASVVDEAKRAATLDPLSPQAYSSLFWNLIWAREYDDALVVERHAEQVGLIENLAAYWKGRVALAQGDAKRAASDCQTAKDYHKDFCLALAEHQLGHQSLAEQSLAHFRAASGDNGAALYADIYAQWGQRQLALDMLETAYRLHDSGMIESLVDPFLDPVRDDPRFQDIVRRMNFPAP